MAPRTRQAPVRRAIAVSVARVASTHRTRGDDSEMGRGLNIALPEVVAHNPFVESGRAPLWSLVAQSRLFPWSLVAQANSRLKMSSISLRE